MSVGNLRLVDLIRQRFDAGALPRERPTKMGDGYGVGDTCSGCGDPVGKGQGAFEFDIAGQSYRFHTGCYGLWEGELIRRGLFKPQ